MLDIIEHLKDPEAFMEMLRTRAVHKRPEIVLTTANIGFMVTRLMLLFASSTTAAKAFSTAHTRGSSTWRSLRELFEQTGYNVLEIRGIPAPFPKVVATACSEKSSCGERILRPAVGLSRAVSYQIYVRAQAHPTVPNLLEQTISSSEKLREENQAGRRCKECYALGRRCCSEGQRL